MVHSVARKTLLMPYGFILCVLVPLRTIRKITHLKQNTENENLLILWEETTICARYHRDYVIRSPEQPPYKITMFCFTMRLFDYLSKVFILSVHRFWGLVANPVHEQQVHFIMERGGKFRLSMPRYDRSARVFWCSLALFELKHLLFVHVSINGTIFVVHRRQSNVNSLTNTYLWKFIV